MNLREARELGAEQAGSPFWLLFWKSLVRISAMTLDDTTRGIL